MPDKRLKISDRIAARIIGGETVIVGLDDNTMNILNDVGTFIWERVDAGKTLHEIIPEICAEYEVDEQTAKRDTETFVEEMLSKKIFLESDD
ncbi:MAG TPA: PqqD family protein [Acidobacteriota bacterium]|jgi:hypothetical protein